MPFPSPGFETTAPQRNEWRSTAPDASAIRNYREFVRLESSHDSKTNVDLPVDAPLRFSPLNWYDGGNEFQMPVIEKVLAHD